MLGYQATQVRRRSLTLFLCLLPMLTYIGHWPRIAFDVPFTNGYWEIPFVSEPAGHHHTADPRSEAEHEQHCHANVANCLNGTTAAIAFATLLLAALEMAARNGMIRDARLLQTRAPAGLLFRPDVPPPRL